MLSLFPKFQELDVDTYKNWTDSIDAIRTYVQSHKDSIYPVLLRTSSTESGTPDEFERAVAITRAIQCLAAGKSLDKATRGIAGYMLEVTQEVYQDRSPSSGLSERPTDDAVSAAQRLINWIL